jgi:hypothetical protein
VELGFEIPPYTPIRVRRERIYTVVRDSLGVPFVVRTAAADLPVPAGR